MRSSQKQTERKLREIDEELLTPSQVFKQVGATLVGLHHLEKTIRNCTRLIQLASPKDEDEIEKFWRMKRKTCGALVQELRGTLSMEPGFDRILSRLVRRRNAFAHKLFTHTPFKPTASDSWLRNVSRFCWALYSDMVAVEDVFLALWKEGPAHSETNPNKDSATFVASAFLGFKPLRKR